MFDQRKRYGILGLARSGIAAAYKIKSLGGSAYLSDTKQEAEIANSRILKQDFVCEFGGHSDALLNCDEWIVSPGIPLTAPIIQKGNQSNIRMISELEFGFQIKHPDSKIIAVTGSNGKSTTASLIAHIFQQSGRRCVLAGNIGDAFCSFPIETADYEFIVLEVSSFQLDLIETFRPDIALLLNVTPDHLNRYSSFDDYALSKFRMFVNQTEDDYAILNLDDPVITQHAAGIRSHTKYFSLKDYPKSKPWPDVWMLGDTVMHANQTTFFKVSDLWIKGPHNWANAMAAILACSAAGVDETFIKAGLSSFVSLKHRLQFVQNLKGISFFNDSKATNTDSVRYALLSFEKPIRIIMGGSDKGEDFGVLTEILAKHAQKVYITGATAEKMVEAWAGNIPYIVIDDFEKCIRQAYEESSEGDNIVLSPACASYDRFRNFEDRGDTFISIVKKLVNENEKEK